MKTRLHKFIASTGIVSRRKAEQLIAAGQVAVNGKPVTTVGSSIDPATDVVSVGGRKLEQVQEYFYVLLNKPAGVVCTRAQFKDERTVYDLVPRSRDLVIAGRLDKDSEGLALLSNDGELTNRLTHPRYGHTKIYEVELVKPLTEAAMERLRAGVSLSEGTAMVDDITHMGGRRYRLSLHQGWKRQIRRMMSVVHNDVVKLIRVQLGKLTLGDLKSGQYREVDRDDIL